MDSNANLSTTAAWFRDSFYKVLGWGVASTIILAGWLISADGDQFQLRCSDVGLTLQQKAASNRALALLVSWIVFYGGWALIAWTLRKKCQDHETMISKKATILFVLGIVAISGFFIMLVVD